LIRFIFSKLREVDRNMLNGGTSIKLVHKKKVIEHIIVILVGEIFKMLTPHVL